MFKRTLTFMLLIGASAAFAQNNSISPYSFFGVGDIQASGTVENQQMGGIGMYADSIHVNLQNPAAYGKLKLTTYTIGGSHREFRLRTFEEEQNTSVTNLEYLALAFPISQKWGVGFGLEPFSSVGYALESESFDNEGDRVINTFTGDGGVNRIFISTGLELFKDLYLGASLRFNFGTLNNERLQSEEGVQFGTLDRRESRVKGVDLNYGLIYTPKIGEKHTLFTSVRVDTQANLESENSQTIGSFSLATGEEIEVIDVDLEAQGLKRTDLKIPTTYTFGLGYGQDKKWFVGLEYGFQELSSFTNAFLNADQVEYIDSSSLALGVFFIPDFASFSSYLKRINYRAGLRYDKTGLVVNGKEIENFGITFGLGLPLGGAFSNVNLGFELGRRGTQAANLIEESYLKIGVGLSLNDRWFQKRKIN